MQQMKTEAQSSKKKKKYLKYLGFYHLLLFYK